MTLKMDADDLKALTKQKKYLKFRIVKRAVHILLLLVLYFYFKSLDGAVGASIFLALAVVYLVVIIEQIYALYKLNTTGTL